MEEVKDYVLRELNIKKLIYDHLSKSIKIKMLIMSIIALLVFIAYFIFFNRYGFLSFVSLMLTFYLLMRTLAKAYNSVLRNKYGFDISVNSVRFATDCYEKHREKLLLKFLVEKQLNSPSQIETMISVFKEESDELRFKGLFSKGLLFAGMLAIWNNYINNKTEEIRNLGDYNVYLQLLSVLIGAIFIYEILAWLFNGLIYLMFNQYSDQYKKIARLLKKTLVLAWSEQKNVS
jgi:hypothetical protein